MEAESRTPYFEDLLMPHPITIPPTHCPVCGSLVGYIPRHGDGAGSFLGETYMVMQAYCEGWFVIGLHCEWVGPYLSAWGNLEGGMEVMP